MDVVADEGFAEWDLDWGDKKKQQQKGQDPNALDKLIDNSLESLRDIRRSASRKVKDGKSAVKSVVKPMVRSAEHRRKKVRGVIRKMLTGDKNHRLRDLVRGEFGSQKAVKTLDKISFTLGVMVVVSTEYVLLKRPDAFWQWYTAMLVPLMAARYYLYHQRKQHLYMLDFCYFVQLMCLATVYVAPNNPQMFQVTFAAANGPLLWAIVAWRNSLVFHSLDKTTSLFIHVFPALLTYSMRWHPGHYPVASVCASEDCSFGLSDTLFTPLVMYSFWQLLYVFQTEKTYAEDLKADADIETSMRYFLNAGMKNPMYALAVGLLRKVRLMGRDEKLDAETWKGKCTFMFSQLVYTVITLLPVKFLFESEMAHTYFLIIIHVVALWNGANYYFEAFTKHYMNALANVQRKLEEQQQAHIDELAKAVGDQLGPGGRGSEDGRSASGSSAGAGSESRGPSLSEVSDVSGDRRDSDASGDGAETPPAGAGASGSASPRKGSDGNVGDKSMARAGADVPTIPE